MNIFFLLLISLKLLLPSNANYNFPLKEIIFNPFFGNNLKTQNSIRDSLLEYLETFDGFDKDLFNKCTTNLFNKTGSIENFLHLISYSGKGLSDLGQETSCLRNNFSYYLFSYNYDGKDDKSKIFTFLNNSIFYTGLCLFNECNDFLSKIFNGYSDTLISETKVQQIIYEEQKDCKNNLTFCKNKPYYSLNEKGEFDENLTEKEKSKYKLFYILFIITIFIICIEIIISIFIYCGYYLFNNSKNLTNELYEESDLDEDEDNSEDDVNEKVLYSNSSSSKEKKYESCSQLFIKTLYKYFSFFTNIIILTMRKSKFFNNKNLETIIKLRLLTLILITFSTNFDIYIKLPSKGFYNDFLYKQIYFIFLKFASFGLDMYICLDGFEVMYKLMNYFKKNFFDRGKKTITFLGIFKFYLFSVYKIIGYIILFLITKYFNRYYIYMHNGGTLYSFYSNNINNNKNIFQIFNPKYTIFSYLPINGQYDFNFLFNSKMSLLFINEFYAFTFLLIIFYIGNILKTKIFDYAIIVIILISYAFSFVLDYLKNNQDEKLYNYNQIIRNISLIKFPNVLFNHYLIGAFTGLTCFYLKDSNGNNSMINEPDKCPFNFCLKIIELFDYLVQKGRKIWIVLSFIIQFMICSAFTIIINLKKNSKFPLEFETTLKAFYYYESGLFILLFCFNILFFANDNNSKNYDNYNILNLFYQINFSYVNTIYLLMYSYYCFFGFQLKLTYQNLWLITLGLFVFFSIENLIITIIFIMPFKFIFKTLLDNYLVINPSSLSIDEIKINSIKKINNSGFSNGFINNGDGDYLNYDNNDNKNDISK